MHNLKIIHNITLSNALRKTKSNMCCLKISFFLRDDFLLKCIRRMEMMNKSKRQQPHWDENVS